MNGFISVLKPPGLSSHDVVSNIRQLINIKKVGHAGTLDPEAAGVLVIGVGKATRLLEYLQLSRKSYRAEMTFGITTTTQDQEGEVVERKTAGELNTAQVQAALSHFNGKLQQVPPAFSALKHQGQPLYKFARQGKKVKIQSREVEVYQIELLKFYPDETYPRALIDLSCSKGTYVRTICHDLGSLLGFGAHLSTLVRTAVGSFGINGCFTLEELKVMSAKGDTSFLISMAEGVAELPKLVVSSSESNKVLNGVSLSAGIISGTEGYVRVLDNQENLLAIGEIVSQDESKSIKMRKVFK